MIEWTNERNRKGIWRKKEGNKGTKEIKRKEKRR
jgi:hypothetical protein